MVINDSPDKLLSRAAHSVLLIMILVNLILTLNKYYEKTS